MDRSELKVKAGQILCAFGKGLTEMPIMFPQLTLALLVYHHSTQVRARMQPNFRETCNIPK